MFTDGLFRQKRILVTGGGTGLGKGMAEKFLALGAELIICGRRKSVCEETAAELMAKHGGKVEAYGIDIRDAAAVDAMVEDIFKRGPLSDLVNNAAGNFISRTEDLSPRGFDAIANIVMHGTFYVTHAVGRRWIAAQKPGNVLSIVVTWIHNGSPFVVPSAMSKAAIHAMTMSLAAEWGRYGIHRRRRQAAAPDRDAGEPRRALEPDGPPRPHGGAAESRDVPALQRLRLAHRPDRRHGRRQCAGDRRQFLRSARMGRCGMESRARGDPAGERAGQGGAQRVTRIRVPRTRRSAKRCAADPGSSVGPAQWVPVQQRTTSSCAAPGTRVRKIGGRP
jgi:NAD(P)-dependent dehydrogenase (short-subunit alcohol dehydrogenase family)